MKKLFNILGFQAGWWACVIGATKDYKYLGPAAMLLFLLLHFYFFSSHLCEIYLVIISAIIGTGVDTLMALTGIISYQGLYSAGIHCAPLWITAMWGGFSATVNHSLAWLKNRWLPAFALGAVFGPGAYITGEKFGAIHFNSDILLVTVMLAIVWGISIPGIYWLNEKLGLGSIK
tara:strand:+ start:2514 stop:3038 length:525 start_codon:yes stop_codon:yes gene_type:complete